MVERFSFSARPPIQQEYHFWQIYLTPSTLFLAEISAQSVNITIERCRLVACLSHVACGMWHVVAM